jgi:glycosyltransferase involved in cell wall biosynthesis
MRGTMLIEPAPGRPAVTLRPAAFAIPGDHRQKTGGFIYERRLLEELQAQGRDVRHLHLPASFPDPSPADEAATARILAQVPPDRPLILDGLVFGSLRTDLLAALPAPVVAMVHHPLGLENGLPGARARALLERERANLALAARIVVPSPHAARTFAQVLGADASRITVALPGIDGARLPARAERDVPLILSVGLLCRRKGHDVLLRALERVQDLPWTCAIVGKDYDPLVKAELQTLLPRLDGRAELLGEVDDATLARLMREASLFALATRFEGYGLALAEALAGGLPIVTCRAGAVPETVGDGALLVPPEDEAALAEALRGVLTDGALRRDLAARAAREGLALPRWSDTAAAMGRVLDSL